MKTATCDLTQAAFTSTTRRVCEDCVKTGSGWVHLRECMICGEVHCCDSSPNKHATQHFHVSGHDLVRSIEPDEVWGYCYTTNSFVDEGFALEPMRWTEADRQKNPTFRRMR